MPVVLIVGTVLFYLSNSALTLTSIWIDLTFGEVIVDDDEEELFEGFGEFGKLFLFFSFVVNDDNVETEQSTDKVEIESDDEVDKGGIGEHKLEEDGWDEEFVIEVESVESGETGGGEDEILGTALIIKAYMKNTTMKTRQ